MRIAILLACLLPSIVSAQAKKDTKADFSRGEKLVRDYFQDQVRDIESRCLTNLTTRAAWEKDRVERRRQFFDMMGLWPLPPRTDLKPTIKGTTEGEGFTVEKLHFQSRPGLYVTANLYLPAKPPASMPGLLICHSHHNPKTEGELQDMGMTWARQGCAVLVMDQLGHGERRQRQPPFWRPLRFPFRRPPHPWRVPPPPHGVPSPEI